MSGLVGSEAAICADDHGILIAGPLAAVYDGNVLRIPVSDCQLYVKVETLIRRSRTPVVVFGLKLDASELPYAKYPIFSHSP